MRLLHVPYTFHPDAVGGTEVYVEALARELLARGTEVAIAAPGPRDTCYLHAGTPVWRFVGSTPDNDLRAQYGRGDPGATRAFVRVLEAAQPDLVHLHSCTSAVSLGLVAEAKARGIPVVFTYHTPTVSCQRGTLLRWGTEPCDGMLRLRTCAACTLHGLGLSRSVSTVLALTPEHIGQLIGAHASSGRVWTALRMTELTGLHHAARRDLFEAVDHVVAVCGWARDLLYRNGVPRQKISLSRHGLAAASASSPQGPALPADARPLRLAFVGRLDRAKGVDVVLRAFRSTPSLDAILDVYGVAQGPGDALLRSELQQLIGDDRRIQFLPSVEHTNVVSALARYHALVVPSQCLETGPLVVLEAHAAGVPVVGSDLGGIRELVNHQQDGVLVQPADDPGAWTRALCALANQADLLPRLRAGIRPPRTMADVATDMEAVYARVRPGL